MKVGYWKIEDTPELEKGLEDLQKVSIVLLTVGFALLPIFYLPKTPIPGLIGHVVLFLSVTSLFGLLFSIMVVAGEKRSLRGEPVTRVSREGGSSRMRVVSSSLASAIGYACICVNILILIPVRLGSCKPLAVILILLWMLLAPYGGYRFYYSIITSLLSSYTASPSMVEKVKKVASSWFPATRPRRVLV